MPPGLSQPSPDYLARDAVAELPDLEDVRLLHAAHKPGYNTELTKTDSQLVSVKITTPRY